MDKMWNKLNLNIEMTDTNWDDRIKKISICQLELTVINFRESIWKLNKSWSDLPQSLGETSFQK